MAGMLPGVECARRRRFYGGGPSLDSAAAVGHGRSRRASFCLYISSHETRNHSSNSLASRMLRKWIQEDDEKLGGVAREAKERLDERLMRASKKPDTSKARQRVGGESLSCAGLGELRTEVYGSRRSDRGGGSGRLPRWARFGSTTRASGQEECSICLEQFRSGETLVNLPCAHRFHSHCLVPWLDTSSHCPYCRLDIISGVGFLSA